jgi:GTP-binding protein
MVGLFEGLRPFIDREVDEFPDDDEAEMDEEELLKLPLKIAIVGRPNAGKSTLVNKMLGEDRMITGPEAGITRDSISIDWTWKDEDGRERAVRLIDTAGLRKKARVQDKLEKLSVADTLRAVDFAEVVVLLLDGTRGLELQDLKIADQIWSEGRALIIALNKWDVAEHQSSLFQGVRGALDEGLAQAKGVPLFAVSARTGKGLDQMLQAAFDVREQWSKRVGTGQLNRWFGAAVEKNPPPAPGGRRIKLRYITQIKSRPPSFVLFGNRLDELPESYRRYLVNGIRKELGFGTVPVRLTMRNSKNPFDTKD